MTAHTRQTSRAHRSPRSRTTRTAFSLMEAIIAIVITSVAVPGMTWALRDAAQTRANAILMSRARWRAVEKLEDIIADRHSPSASRGYAYLANANYPAESPISGEPGFSRTVSFTETTADLTTAGTGFETATVTVSWKDGNNVTRTFAASTVLTSYTP